MCFSVQLLYSSALWLLLVTFLYFLSPYWCFYCFYAFLSGVWWALLWTLYLSFIKVFSPEIFTWWICFRYIPSFLHFACFPLLISLHWMKQSPPPFSSGGSVQDMKLLFNPALIFGCLSDICIFSSSLPFWAWGVTTYDIFSGRWQFTRVSVALYITLTKNPWAIYIHSYWEIVLSQIIIQFPTLDFNCDKGINSNSLK